MKNNILRPFLLWGLALSDVFCWTAVFWQLVHLRNGARPDVVTVCLAAMGLLLAALFAALWQGVFQQLDDLLDAVRHWDDVTPADRDIFLRSLSGPVGSLGTSVFRRSAELENRLASIRQETAEETERTVKQQIARDICQSALPQRLPDYASRENFETAGTVRDGWHLSCVFYDYFYIDPGLLCVAVGQVPDGEVPEALYMTVAQTAIRSRLRLGRSLAETMADVNTQMYDLGSDRSAAVLVGTLDTSIGKFSYVNAGGCLPLLVKNGEDCQWLESPVFAALGQNQSVTYRTQELRLRQGDRLILHTAGLGGQKNAEGAAFRDQELRAVLNRARTEGGTPEELLHFMEIEADAFCARPEDRLGYAALLLEFRKGDKELSHCRVEPLAENSPEVMEFLKTRFAQNGIQKKHYARAAVLGEELFSICCRCAEQGSIVTVECGVAPDGESINLRMSGQFGGKNPLVPEETDSPSSQAAEYIDSHADFTSFKSKKGVDTVTLVCFLEQV